MGRFASQENESLGLVGVIEMGGASMQVSFVPSKKPAVGAILHSTLISKFYIPCLQLPVSLIFRVG